MIVRHEEGHTDTGTIKTMMNLGLSPNQEWADVKWDAGITPSSYIKTIFLTLIPTPNDILKGML